MGAASSGKRVSQKQGAEVSESARLMGAIASKLIEYVEVAAIAILLAFFLRTFVVEAFKIPTGSMEDTLLAGDHILVNKMVYHDGGLGPLEWILPVRDPDRFDIMVFKNPRLLKQDYVKRLMGLPGDVVSSRRKELWVNGEQMSRPFERHKDPQISPPSRPGRDDFGPWKVPESNYFMMGDNRDNSLDSRYWGPLKRELVKGEAFLIYWSWEPGTASHGGMGYESVGQKLVSFAKLVWLNVTHLGDRLRWHRLFSVVR